MNTGSRTARSISVRAALCGFLLFMGGCRIFTGEVACRADRDCPWDVLSFCTSYDGGLGVCTNDEEYQGDYLAEDAGTGDDLDAGQQIAAEDAGELLDANDAVD